jgi:hypothetical protein
MKLLIVLLLSLTASISFGFSMPATEIHGGCQSPTTVFSVDSSEGKVLSTVVHPLGIQHSAFFKGNVLLTNLAVLELQAKIFQKLGNSQTFTWPLNQCQVSTDDPRIFDCTGGEPLNVGGVELRPVTLRTMVSNLKMNIGDYEIYTMSIVFLVDNEPSLPGVRMFEFTQDYSFNRDCH